MIYNTIIALVGMATVLLIFYFIVPVIIFLTVKMYWNAKFQAFSESFLESSAKSTTIRDLINRIAKD
jgi:hypothetical protein